MADTVTSQIYDGAHNVVGHFTNLSDGTGEAAVTKIDVSTLVPDPDIHLVIWRVEYDVKGGGVQILWDAGADSQILFLSGASRMEDYRRFGGLRVPAGLAGATGDILFTTQGFMPNSGYTITLHCKKGGVL